jgi:hypothetical protein
MFGGVRASDVLSLFEHLHLVQEERGYLEYHAGRLAFLLNLVTQYAALLSRDREQAIRVLDVGPHFLTTALRHWLGPDAVLDTIGWANHRVAPPGIANHHIDFDLNDAQYPERWPRAQPHDVIVAAEVIEHLYTSPRLVLSFLRTFLDSDGRLFIQTPNAVSLRKRVKMLLARHPYELIREARDNPGHFREYTGDELCQLCRGAAIVPEQVIYANYWPDPWPVRILGALNGRLRNGLTVIARNDPGQESRLNFGPL